MKKKSKRTLALLLISALLADKTWTARSIMRQKQVSPGRPAGYAAG